jgi:hypothetical protein
MSRRKASDDDDGELYKRSFMDRAIDAQSMNKRIKSTFKFILQKKSRRGSKLKKPRAASIDVKSQSTKITKGSSSGINKGLSHFASAKKISPKKDVPESKDHEETPHNIPLMDTSFKFPASGFSSPKSNSQITARSPNMGEASQPKLSRFSKLGTRKERKFNTNIQHPVTSKIEVDKRRCKTQIAPVQ